MKLWTLKELKTKNALKYFKLFNNMTSSQKLCCSLPSFDKFNTETYELVCSIFNTIAKTFRALPFGYKIYI